MIKLWISWSVNCASDVICELRTDRSSPAPLSVEPLRRGIALVISPHFEKSGDTTDYSGRFQIRKKEDMTFFSHFTQLL